jgi:RNA-directed DNA polymerase
MVVLVPDSVRGRPWAHRALECVGREAEALGVTLNEDKTRQVCLTDPRAVFTFLGFEFRWRRSARTGRWYSCTTPRPTKLTEVLRTVRVILRQSRALPMWVAVARVNPIVRGWVNYFRIGNSSQAFGRLRDEVERKVRRFASRKCKRQGFGWKRWSSEVVYGAWGLYDDYRLTYGRAKVGSQPNGIITPV